MIKQLLSRVFPMMYICCVLCVLCAPTFSGGAQDSTSFRLGDVNGDGVTDSTDARLLLQHEVGLLRIPMADIGRADVTFDGVSDSSDARIVLQKEVGIYIPQAWTENITEDVSGESATFTPLGTIYFTPANGKLPQLLIIQSPSEYTAVMKVLGGHVSGSAMPLVYGDESFFDTQSILLYYYPVDVKHRVDTILTNNQTLIVCHTVTRHHLSLPWMASSAIMVAVDNSALYDIRSIIRHTTMEQEPPPSGS